MNDLLQRESINGKVEFPTTLVNVFYIPNSNIFFKGKLYGMQFDCKGIINLEASLSKYEYGKKTERKSLFNKQQIEKPYQNLLWTVNTACADLYEERGSQLKISSSDDLYYGTKLFEELWSRNIALDNEVFEKVFKPLEQKIEEFMK